jgi:predicted PhzF superfamily epimerase YddE/YHI9
MATLHVLRVFTAPGGEYGNPLGVFLEGGEIAGAQRQGVATELGFSETVFVDEPAGADVRIFTPAAELAFAGHPTVGAAWLLAQQGMPVARLRPPAGEVPVRYDDELTWIAARPEWVPPFELVQLDSPEAVDGFEPARGRGADRYYWAWSEAAAGRVRARAFFPGLGIVEDEATGAAAVALCAQQGRPIEIQQGRGSALLARPLGDGMVEVGGRCVLDEVRRFSSDAARPA